jgi:membrane fusion protein (multidrug efflux system)
MEQIATKPPRRTRRWVTLAALAVSAAGLTGLALSQRGVSPVAAAEAADAATKDKDAKDKPATPVAVARVEAGRISAYVNATANLVAEDEVEVVAEAEGKVVELLVDEGQSVRKGQKLLQIDRGDAALAVQKAELALRNATIGLERSDKMAAERLISPQDLDKVRYERDVAAHELEQTRHNLQKTVIAAPFSGRITLRQVQLGQTVKPGDALFTLADFEPLVARIFLPEREVLTLRVGQTAQLALKAADDVRFEGRIQKISPVVDTASGTVKVTVEAVAPPSSVRPGAFVSVGIVRETRPQALIVPRPAVIRELQETFVFVAEGDVARRRSVRVGLEEGDRLELLGGVAAGEQVVTSGQGALKDGARIKVGQGA